MARSLRRLLVGLALALTLSCSGPRPQPEGAPPFSPSEIVDLGALVTEDLPERMLGRRT